MDKFRAKLERITESSPIGWVNAGNYFRVKDLLMDQADVAFLAAPPVSYCVLEALTAHDP
ncbi:MAG: hypothetical protein CL879_00895 [Dehalococcoidia bacterium]|nr:hypothetical protein [Dehalococcoidia bacterium]